MRSRTKRELYKGRIVQACALRTEAGKWQPVISIQLSGGDTDFYQTIVEEEFTRRGEQQIQHACQAPGSMRA